MIRRMSDIVAIIDAIARDVFGKLGSGSTEPAYDRAMEVGLRLRNIKYESKKVLELKYEGHYVGEGFADLVVFSDDGAILVELKAIGVDEIQYAKGHKYLTLVYQIDLGVTRLLWVGKERTIESFQGFFITIGDEVASRIAFVCSPMPGTRPEKSHP